MEIEFRWNGVTGRILIDCAVNNDPERLGCPPEAEGFPACTATVEYPMRGYRSLFGWVQLVRSTDNQSHGQSYDMDPILLFFDAPSPYGWYGTAPTLFDAPVRLKVSDMSWECHSFLATTPLDEVMEGRGRCVVPLVGFAWGFDIADGTVTVRDVAPLSRTDWDDHLPILRDAYPTWRFEEGIS
jgi:hypothetical protein